MVIDNLMSVKGICLKVLSFYFYTLDTKYSKNELQMNHYD